MSNIFFLLVEEFSADMMIWQAKRNFVKRLFTLKDKHNKWKWNL